MARRRELNVFSLSFLDIMSCGFGAVILIFIVINHSTEITPQGNNQKLLAEVKKVELEVKDETLNLAQLKNTLTETNDEIITTEARVFEIITAIRKLQAQIKALDESGTSQQESIAALKSELKLLEEEAASLKGSVAGADAEGSSLRTIAGTGDRQYLTGLKIGGLNILILLDASASMLDKTIVNVIRRRNMSDENKLASKKWQRAIETVDWIMANMPADSEFQLVTFNTEATSVIKDSKGNWLKAIDKPTTDKAMSNLRKIIPAGGTSLYKALTYASNMKPEPDNVFLITDGLPTQGNSAPKKSAVTSRDRVKFFSDALNQMSGNSPINVILFPMEGDPIAAPSFWRVAQITGGSFLSPPKDWP